MIKYKHMGNESQPKPPEKKLGRGRPASETGAHKVRRWIATGLWGGMGLFTVGSLITFMVIGGESAPDMIGGDTNTQPQDPEADVVKERDEVRKGVNFPDRDTPVGPNESNNGPNGSKETSHTTDHPKSVFAPSTPDDVRLNLEELAKHAYPTGTTVTRDGMKYDIWHSYPNEGHEVLVHHIPHRG
jgi:hypothetical protein